ncbi:condensation domain-containing protein, partial [Streptomyces massasporeus]
ALTDVTDRHEALRTLFAERESDGQAYQRILPAGTAVPVVEHLRAGEDEVPGIVDAAVRRPFDLASELPIRATVVEVAPDDHVVVLLLHHITTDEWSDRPFLRDLTTAYTARLAAAAPDWEPLPVQYADYALWQHRLLGDPADADSLAARQLEHWHTALAGAPEELELPTDRPRPARPAFTGAELDITFDRTVHEGLRRLARDTGASMFMVAHAAVAALLHRLGAGTDIPLGAPIAGRGDEALDELVGFFVNTVVLRADLSGDPSFATLLERVRAADLAALDHSDLPFDTVVETVNPVRSLTRHPLFQTMVSHSTVTQDVRALFGLDARVDRVDPGVTKFDLDITFSDTAHGEALDLEVFYSSALFDRETVETLAERLLRLLTEAVADPAAPVSSYELRSGTERDLLERWNDTAVAHPGESVVEVLDRRIADTPEAV